ncbi:MAG TPA: MFS transporter [Ktedonobacteraceae bacterium]|nr:MFS transporter [Ktedonobacteraceae bacterium]
MRALLKNRSLLIIGLAESVSGIGNWITIMAIFAIIVFVGHGSIGQISFIWLASLIPMLFIGPVVGWLCDHYNRKWLMIISELSSGLVVVFLIFTRQLWLIYLLLALQSICGAVMTPARQAAIPTLVDKDNLTRANALLQQLAGIIKIGAPILAGALLAFLAPQQAMVLDIISFVISAALLSTLPNLLPQKQAEVAIDLFHESEQATTIQAQPAKTTLLGTLKSLPLLRLLFIAAFLAALVVMNFDILAPIFIRDTLHQQTSFYGSLIGLVGLGLVLGTLLLMVRKGTRDPWNDIILGVLLLCLFPASIAITLLKISPEILRIFLLLGCLTAGFGFGLLSVQASTLLQKLSPPDAIGRIGGLYQSSMAAAQLISLAVTPLLVPLFISVSVYSALASVALVILTIVIILTLYQTRKHPNLAQPQPAGIIGSTSQLAEDQEM